MQIYVVISEEKDSSRFQRPAHQEESVQRREGEDGCLYNRRSHNIFGGDVINLLPIFNPLSSPDYEN